jgi:signal transduction histidine kinase
MRPTGSSETGTNRSTRGLRRFHRRPVINWRLFLFAPVVGLGVLLILWLQAGVGSRLKNLEGEFSALKAETFLVATQMRVQFRSLNATLLNLYLNREGADPTRYRAEARQLQDWLAQRRPTLITSEEKRWFDVMAESFANYQASAERLLKNREAGLRRSEFADTYEKVQELSAPVMDAVAQLVQAQQTAFDRFLADSRRTLVGLNQLLNFSLVLLIAAGSLLVVLIYRGMITPLYRRLTESEHIILRQEKLAALGTLAAGVAHEIRNPLTAIKFRLFSCKKALPTSMAENEDILVIDSEINRLDRIVKDFLHFARPSEPELTVVSSQRLLQEIADLLAPELRKAGIQLQMELGQPIFVQADPPQLKQVLINLVQNAADSIEREGTITLRAFTGVALLSGRSRPVAIFAVADTGKGIPPEVEKRLFDPFFSTKENGTGLGLPIAARIIEKHGGSLRYRTERNRGTVFEILLPHPHEDATGTPDR